MKKILLTGILIMCVFLLGGCQSADSTGASQATNTSGYTDSSAVENSSPTVSQSGSSESSSLDDKSVASQGESVSPEDDATSNGTKTLVVYFSRTGEQYGVGNIDKGNTAIIADMIIEKTGADSFEILPQEDYYPYTYDALTDIAKQELNDNARPAIKGTIPDLSKYDTVFIGAPVWWGDWPMIMYTFFEGNRDALARKTLIPFSTHAGSGLSGFDSKLSSACPDSTVGTGLAIAGTDAQNNQDSVRQSVNNWLSGLGYYRRL